MPAKNKGVSLPSSRLRFLCSLKNFVITFNTSKMTYPEYQGALLFRCIFMFPGRNLSMRTSTRKHFDKLVCLIISLSFFVLTPSSLLADIDAPISTSEDYELDLGPQGKAKNRDLYGFGTLLQSEDISAGSWGSWELTYNVGKLGVDDGGRVFLLFNAVADWGKFQMDKPQGENFVSARTSNGVQVSIGKDSRHAGPRPFWGGLVLTVREGNLMAGDKIVITLGDRSGGSPGLRAPTISPHLPHEFRFMVDPLNAVRPVRVLDSPNVRIIGAETVRLEALWPSEAAAGEKTWLLVKAKDQWGNPAKSYAGSIQFDTSSFTNLPETYRFTAADEGYHRFEDITAPAAGNFILGMRDKNNSELSARTNLMVVKDSPEFQLYCGDLHGQHVRGSTNLQQYAAYAQGFAGIDFMSWAVNDFHITKNTWQGIQTTSEKFNAPGRFVVFPGYEWSGTTGRGGDHNVVYFEENETLYRSAYVEEDLRGYDPAMDRYSVDSLIASLRTDRVFLMPHIGGRRANLDFYDPKIMPIIEIYSAHGQFEWFLKDALTRGLKVGFAASSDDVFGKLGDSIPGSGLFAVRGGLTCIFAENLSRKALWQAIQARRVYGTTGERMQLRFKSGNHWLGEEIHSQKPVTFSVESSGTAGIERVELFRGTELVHTHNPKPEQAKTRYKLIWRGAASRERGRQTVWQGAIRLSSGTFKNIMPYRLDYPTEEYRQKDAHTITFDTITAGDEDGLVLMIDGLEDTSLSFESVTRARGQFDDDSNGTRSISFSIPINEITAEDVIYSAGGVDREVVLRKVGSDYPRSIRFDWADKEPPEQTTAYWVRVLQEDGATAWSSPIFVSP
jgi:hypothetical protein